jgi:hypothetical protein
MARSMISSSDSVRPRRVSLAVGQACAIDVEPTVKARMLRELAAWYRTLAARAANPVIWEWRLITADGLGPAASMPNQRLMRASAVCEPAQS